MRTTSDRFPNAISAWYSLGPVTAAWEALVRARIPVLASLAWLGCVVLVGTNAGAESYQILEGSVSAAGVGLNQALTGSFEAFPFEQGGAATDLTPLHVVDFAMQAGDVGFTPNPPIGVDGLRPLLFLEVADQINLHGDRVGLLWMRSGGEIVDSSDDHVTYRFLDFRSGPSGGGHAIGQLGDSELPRRLHLEGTLHEVHQTFDIVRGPCGSVPPIIFPPPGGGGGGVIVVGGGDVVVEYDSFDIHPDETVQFVPPDGSGGVITRVTGDGSSIGGDLQGDGQVVIVNPSGVDFGPVTAGTTPTLEELGVTAPDGAIVSYDDVTGELTVSSEGDLFIVGTAIDLPGLTSVRIVTLGSITITGTLSVPADVDLHLEAQGELAIDGEIEAPGGDIVVVPPPVIVPLCQGLRPQPADERPVGSFSLVASAARQIDIDVKPWSQRNLVLPGRRQLVPVAILGSDDLDVRDIDESSLRLGPGEAEPAAWRGRRSIRRGYANRDRDVDLLARFDVRDTGIAYGDDEVCLVAETTDGETLEGCDAIQTLPDWLRRALHRAPRRR